MAVPIWAFAPSRLNLTGIAEALSWVLMVGVLAAATLTKYPLGVARVVPLRVHAWFDRVATPLVIGAPWLGGFSESHSARALFVVMGSFGLIVTLLTDFEG